MNTAFCFDLDGTVTRQEILPAIASELGLAEEIALLTSLTVRGLIPFESSFRLRCQILKQVAISRVRQIVAEIPVDSEIEAFLGRNRERSMVVTGNLDVWVCDLIRRLGCAAATSIGVAEGDRLIRVDKVLRKDEAVHAFRQAGYDRIVAIGESFNDLSMFQQADIRVAFSGVHQPVADVVLASDYIVYSSAGLCRLLATL